MAGLFDLMTVRLLSVGHIQPAAEWRMAVHAHAYWEFIYFLRGYGRVDVPHTSLRPGYYHLLILPPGLPHAEWADPLDPEETIFFAVDVAGTPPPDLPILLADPNSELRWLSEHIYQEFTTSGVITPLAQTYACASLQLIERAWQTRASAHSDPVNLVMQYLIANYSGEITLQELAAIANVTPTHLTHCFTARLGLSPIRYLRHLRIETAKRLLCTTEFLIYDIAQRVGYADHLYFRRVFKEITGQTPSSLRIKSR